MSLLVCTDGIAAETIHLRNLDGVLCVRATVQTDVSEAPVYLAIDLGTRGPLLLHSRTAGLLGISDRGQTTIVFDHSNVRLSEIDTVALELEPLESLTRQFAAELEEIPVAGVLGMPAFSSKGLVLDIERNELVLLSADENPNESQARYPNAQAVETTYTEQGYGYWLTGKDGKGNPLRIRFATSEYDTRINRDSADKLGSPDGQVSKLWLESLDLSRYAVFRPSDLSMFPEPRPDLVIGTGLLSSFQLRIDPSARRIVWMPIAAPELDDAERSFYRACASEDIAAIESFLKAHGDSRLAEEGAGLLLHICMSKTPVDRDMLRRALTLRANVAPLSRRAATLILLADEFIAMDEERSDAYELAGIALELAEPFADADLNSTAVHQINARYGLIALLQKDYKKAHRYLLSAAFGLPKDPYVNLWLGRLYEMKGQTSRAWSRFLESALHDQAPVGAFRGVNRLSGDPDFRKTFTATDADRLIEGRVMSFRPTSAQQKTEDAGEFSPRLLEFFNTIHAPQVLASELAFNALDEDAGLETVLIQYHLDDCLGSEIAKQRQQYYDVTTLPVAIFDGVKTVVIPGDDTIASRVYSAFREQGGAGDSDIGITGSAVYRDGTVDVKLDVRAALKQAGLELYVIVCEKRVIAMGENKMVMHMHVARGAVKAGRDWREVGSFEGTLDDAALMKQLADWDGKRREATGVDRPIWLDPHELEVVAFLQDSGTKRIAAAVTIPVVVKGESTNE